MTFACNILWQQYLCQQFVIKIQFPPIAPYFSPQGFYFLGKGKLRALIRSPTALWLVILRHYIISGKRTINCRSPFSHGSSSINFIFSIYIIIWYNFTNTYHKLIYNFNQRVYLDNKLSNQREITKFVTLPFKR
jgi:hypothetical protein